MNQIIKTIVNVGHLGARVGTIASVVMTAASFLDFWVYGEQLASLRPFILLAALLAVIWFSVFRRPRWGILSVLLVAVGFVSMQPHSQGDVPKRPDSQTHSTLRVLTANAYIGSPDQTQLARLASDTRADLVLVTELDEPLAAQLRSSYPFVHTTELNGVFGMGVFSKYPLTDVSIQLEKTYDSPSIHAALQTPEGPANLILVHPLPPGSQKALKARNQLIDYVAMLTRDSDLPMIVAGDFNTTTWSTHLNPLMAVANRASSGGTWPSHLPLRIPIDHVFFKGFSEQGVFEFTEDYGTDHVPFLTVLRSSSPHSH